MPNKRNKKILNRLNLRKIKPKSIIKILKIMEENKKYKYSRLTLSSLSDEAMKILEDRRKKSGLSRSNQAKLDLTNYYLELNKASNN